MLISGSIVYMFSVALLWLLGGAPRVASQLALIRFSPRSGPTRGGTNITVWGSGFVESSRCNFARLPAASIPSLATIVYNSSLMTCVLPEITTAFQFPENSTHNVIQFRIVTSATEQSSEENFLVFNLTNIFISSISPRSGIILSTENEVQFSGNRFVNTSEIHCFIGELREPATFIDQHTVSCKLPSYPVPSVQYPQLSLNSDSSGFVSVHNASNAFVFFSTAPVLESAIFSSSAAQLILTFDREVEIGKENSTNAPQLFDCASIFDSSTIGLLGTGASCDWQTSQQCVIIIQLDAGTVIAPSDNVTLNGQSIRTRGVEYSLLSSSSVMIPVPEGLIPVAILEAPGTIPTCGMLQLVARNSLYGGGRPLTYTWSVFTNNDTVDATVALSTESSVEIPASVFTNTSIYYNFAVTVTNFLGLQDNAIVYLQKDSSPAIAVYILGSPTRSYPVDSDSIIIEAMTEMDCIVDGINLVYSWVITDNVGGALMLGLTALNNADLWIPPLALQPGTVYNVNLTVRYSDDPSTSGIASIQLLGEHPKIVAAMQTGYKASFRVTEPIYLDTSSSRGLLADQTYQYSWQCDFGSCGLPDSNSLTISAGSLPVGSYQFMVTIIHLHSGLFSTASTIIEVIAADSGAAPSVMISLPLKWNALSGNDKITVKGLVSVPAGTSVQWSTVEVKSSGYDYKPIDDSFSSTPKSYLAMSSMSLSPLGDSAAFSSVLAASDSVTDVKNEISLSINPGVLKSGLLYRLKLNATTANNQSAVAEIDIVVESPPTSGRLLVTPQVGISLNTTFILTAVDWTDNFGDPPLLFQFGFQQATKIYWLSPVKFNSHILSYLPITSDNCSIILLLRVYDRSGSFATHTMNVSGISMTMDGRYNAQALMNLVREQVTRYGQVSQGLASLTAITASLNEYSSRFTNEAAFRTDAVDFLLNFSQLANPTKPELNQILFLLEYVTYRMTIDFATQQRLTAFLEHVEQTYQSFQDHFVFSTPGYSVDEASAVFTLYGRMLGGAATRLQANSITSSYIRNLDKLGYGLCRQLGLNEEVVIAGESFGSLKLSHYTPANQITASCVDSENSRCPFSRQDTVDIDFSTTLFNQYISWQCKNNLTCSGVCLLSVQLQRNIFWNGNPYLPHTKSSSLSLYIINPSDGRIELVENLSEPIQFQFPFAASNSTSQCVFWDERQQRWSNAGCSTLVVGDRVICLCDHLSEFTVLAVCPSGYYGDQCQFTCPSDSSYGDECANECTCSVDSDCSPFDGSCDCNPGYTGTTCRSECNEGYYGEDCLELCGCLNGATCDHVTGMCYCTAGWTGSTCGAKCPQGMYGQNCDQACTCRDAMECDHIAGACSCLPGYMGDDCMQECPNPMYGAGCRGNCTSQCDANGTVSMECHHIDGPMCTCNPDYTGQLCQTNTVVPSPLPSGVSNPAAAGFPIVVAIIPVIILIIIIAIIVAIFIHWRWKKYHSNKIKISPTDEEGDNRKRKSIFGEEDGILLTKTNSREVLKVTKKGEKSDSDEEDGIQITRTKSLTVIVPPGAKLQDMFSESQQGASSSFKEPAELGGKFRWQIIHLREKGTNEKFGEQASGSQELLVPTEKGDDEELALKQIPYHQGVYTDPDTTLREVRDLFLETGQLESDNLLFQFLDPNSHNRLFSLEEEDAVTLDGMGLSGKMPRTLFIKTIPDSKESKLEFCLCGRVADFECTNCSARGYCCVECQQEDWHKHSLVCKKHLSKKKNKKKKKKKGPYQLQSPDPAFCVCGVPAEMECSQCGVQGYCSEQCQIAHWEDHQMYCEPHPSSKPATPTKNSTKELPTKETDNTSVGSKAEDKNDITADKPASKSGSALGSVESLTG